MAGPSKVEFPGQKKQSVRMRGTKQANKETSEKMKRQLQHLLDTPYAHLPQLTWSGRKSWFASDPVSKTMKELTLVIPAKDGKKPMFFGGGGGIDKRIREEMLAIFADYNEHFPMLDEIIEFAELEEFIDTPVKRYSSGMIVKLGFSIATSLDAEILIVDEILSVGDLAFQRKCFERMEAMIKSEGKTVLVVSHNIRQILRICDRVILINKGIKTNRRIPFKRISSNPLNK